MGEVEGHLQVLQLQKSYVAGGGRGGRRREVLRGLSLSAMAGEVVGIFGASGCGKSTLLNIIGGLDSADSGTVRLGDVEVNALSDRELTAYRRDDVGMVFQDSLLLDQCTVLENVLLPALAAGRVAASRERALHLLRRVQLGDRAEEYPHRLSGGQRQRAALVRALVNRPRLLLCDEPTGNLDAASGHEVASLLAELAVSEGLIALVVTHNHALRGHFARSLELVDGVLAADIA